MTVVGLAIERAETTVVGIFLLAAVACAALLPPVSQLTQQQLFALPLTVGVGVIAIYPVAIALARPSLNGLRSSGATLPSIFGMTDIVAIAAFLVCAGLIASRRAFLDQGGPSGGTQRSTLGATQSGTLRATHGTTAADRHLLEQAPPPLHARSCCCSG